MASCDKAITVLITTSGTGERLGKLTEYTNKSLVKVGDKYAICYIIESYEEPVEFIITLGRYGSYVKDFLLIAYPTKYFTFIDIDNYKDIGSSLGYSLLKTKTHLQKPFIFHCCDSILTKKININPEQNTLYVYKQANNKHYTSIKGKDNRVTEINNKNYYNFDYIYTGIVYIYNFIEFWDSLELKYNFNNLNNQLSDVDAIKLMLEKKVVFNYNVLDEWYDTGNIDSYNLVCDLFKPKHYVLEKNYESLCFLQDKVIKFINDKDINTKRIIRGNHLYPLTPRIINHNENFMMMEYVEGNILSNVYQNGIIYDVLNWAKQNLWRDVNVNNEYINCCKRFYITKTIDRINKLPLISKSEERNIINGLKCINVIDKIKELPEALFTTNEFVKFHGDFILDNIIKTDSAFKLIDWRHEFDTQLEYGDIYYDLAKLRHNIILNHSNILQDLFTIEIAEDQVIVDLKCNFFLIQELNDFDKFVLENNYNLYKVKLLTALIWLNMAALYDDEKFSNFLFYFGKYNLFLLLN
jgi:NDP-sugar pyrophosphorylase family protein